jgi:hypothetical protein
MTPQRASGSKTAGLERGGAQDSERRDECQSVRGTTISGRRSREYASLAARLKRVSRKPAACPISKNVYWQEKATAALPVPPLSTI